MKVEEKEAFVLLRGEKAHNLNELINKLEKSPDDVFLYHITHEKNDFYNWIRDVLKLSELAERVKNINDKTPFLDELKKWQEEKSFVRKLLRMAKKISVHKKVIGGLKKAGTVIQLSDGSVGSVNAKKNDEKNDLPTTTPEPVIPPVETITLGIQGFDQLILKGIPKGSSILLCGGPGSGKTTFALQTVRHGTENGENCLYLTFEESVENLKRHMIDYGFNPDEAINSGKLIIKKVDPFDLSRSVEALLARATGELMIEINEIEGIIPKDFKPVRIILDSLSAVSAAFAGKEEGYRIYVEQLFNLFQRTGATSFLISEIEQSTEKYSRSGIEEFLADAVIVFYNIRRDNERVSAVEIIKIRGTPFQKKVVPFKILDQKGIVVYPQEGVF
ncbi:AAA family ATPase [Candidatus Woesearchaeota archaeon]|nr:AAA family ATPase [Candidatus Woesearchaeota archaeon]